MSEVSNLKINERSNIVRSNLRVTLIENKNWEIEALKLIYMQGQIWELAKLRVVWNIEWVNNSKVYQFLKPNFGFPNLNLFGNVLIFYNFGNSQISIINIS